jgi:hypothetical protein
MHFSASKAFEWTVRGGNNQCGAEAEECSRGRAKRKELIWEDSGKGSSGVLSS